MKRVSLKIGLKLIAVGILCASMSGCTIWKTFPTMLENLQASLNPIWHLLFAMSYLMGLGLVVGSMYRFKRYGEMRGMMMAMERNLRLPMVMLFIGMCLIYSPTMISAMLGTLFNTNLNQAISYAGMGAWYMDPRLGEALTELIMVVGMVSFLRGWVMLVRMGQRQGQPGVFGKGLMHIVAGLMGINIVAVMGIVRNTFGVG